MGNKKFSSKVDCWMPIVACCLRWGHVLEDKWKYLKESIVIDILMDHITFCLKGHFKLFTTRRLVEYVNNTLLTSPECDTSDIILTLHNELENLRCEELITEQQLICYVEFFTDAILKQYRLIQFVIGHDWERQKINGELCLQVPKKPKRLKDGETIINWSYHQSIKRLTDEEIYIAEQREIQKDVCIGRKNMILEQMKKDGGELKTQEEIVKMTKDVAKIQLDALSSRIKIDLEDYKDYFKYQILKSKVIKPVEERELKADTPRTKTPVKEKKSNKSKAINISAKKK